MSGTHYPRDLIGYAGHPPVVHWPGEARIAVSIVINYEEGGENCILHGDAASEAVLTDVGADALPGQRSLNVESIFEYGSRAGFWSIREVLEARRVPATVYAVGMALERNAPVADVIAASDWEVACHGYRWIDYQTVPEADEQAHIQQNIQAVTRLIGRRPVGWYTGRPGPNTRRLVVQAGGFLYDSDAYSDDLPYWMRVEEQPHLIVPYAFDTNDSRLQRGADFGTGEEFFVYCRDAFDWLYTQGLAGKARMLTIGLHTRIIGRPGRIGALARLLDHMQRHDAVWFCRREDIARHWHAHHPAP